MTEKTISPYLLGAGIVRGLTVTRQLDNNIVLDSGFGYGSDGLPFFCERTMYLHYIPLEARDCGDLPALFEYFQQHLKTPIDCLHIWELKTEMDKETANDKRPFRLLKPQNSGDTEGASFLDDKVTVLYRNPEEARMLPLLMLKTEVAAFTFSADFKWENVLDSGENEETPFSIWGNDVAEDPSKTVSDHDLYLHLNPRLQLPVLGIRRFGYGDLKLEDFSCDEIYTTNFCVKDATSPRYLKDFDSVCREYALIIDAIECDMDAAFKEFHVHFGGIVGDFAKETFNAFWQAFKKRWSDFKATKESSKKTAMQYWYAAFADLTTAYNELRAEALRLNAQNDLNPMAFKRHLLLGSLPLEPNWALPNPFRTMFQQAPIVNGEAEQRRRVQFLHARLTFMMKCFYAPDSDWDDVASDSILTPTAAINDDNPTDIASKIEMPIRLTPSRHLSLPLGQRTIPYYFDLSKSEQSLHWYWDFEATQQHRATEHLSYHSENEEAFVKAKSGEYYAGTEGSAYSQVPHIVQPFAFDMRAFSFVRVEGHIGKVGVFDNTAAPKEFIMATSPTTGVQLMKHLDDLKRQYNVCFNVELHPISALNTYCGKCIEHLGGVYQGGTFILFYEEITPKAPPNTIVIRTFKIVADFTCLSACNSANNLITAPTAQANSLMAEEMGNQTIRATKAVKKR